MATGLGQVRRWAAAVTISLASILTVPSRAQAAGSDFTINEPDHVITCTVSANPTYTYVWVGGVVKVVSTAYAQCSSAPEMLSLQACIIYNRLNGDTSSPAGWMVQEDSCDTDVRYGEREAVAEPSGICDARGYYATMLYAKATHGDSVADTGGYYIGPSTYHYCGPK